MADVHPFSVYDIYADACPADGRGRGRAATVTGQLSHTLGGVGGGEIMTASVAGDACPEGAARLSQVGKG